MTAPLKRLPHELRWIITAHAVQRYLERVAPGMSATKAERELRQHCAGAHFVKMLATGVEQWRGPKPRRLRLRVERKGDRLELVTVLWSYDR